MATEPPAVPVGKLMKADDIAALYRADVDSAVKTFTTKSRRPRLVGILATDSKPSEMYAEFTRKTCESMGVEFELRRVGAAVPSDETDGDGGLESGIIEANEDPDVDGIMVCDSWTGLEVRLLRERANQVYYPIFGGLQDHYLQQVRRHRFYFWLIQGPE